MKVVILAGGMGTRLMEETELKPKPMIEIGGKPMLWHIMKIYSEQGFNEFVICLGYRGFTIKQYFAEYFMHNSDITIDLQLNKIETYNNKVDPWKIHLIDTGVESMTGGRIKRIAKIIGDETFMMTYGDGLADIDLGSLLEFHRSNGKYATVTAVQPSGRFGAFDLESDGTIKHFIEKPKGDGKWVNGGFFVLEPQIFDYIGGDGDSWEKTPMEKLAEDGQIVAYRHMKFWYSMDTLRDKNALEEMWRKSDAPWKKWRD